MLELVKLHQIKSNPNNPRLISKKDFSKLVKSLKEFPQMLWVRPIVLDQHYTPKGGNMRKEAIKEIFDLTEQVRQKLFKDNAKKCNEHGKELARLFFIEKQIPVYVANEFTIEQETEFIIKDNGSFGEWDMETLSNEWSELPLEEWGVKGLDFEEEQEDETPKAKPRKPYIKIEFDSDDDLGNCRGAIQEFLDIQDYEYKLSVSLEVF